MPSFSILATYPQFCALIHDTCHPSLVLCPHSRYLSPIPSSVPSFSILATHPQFCALIHDTCHPSPVLCPPSRHLPPPSPRNSATDREEKRRIGETEGGRLQTSPRQNLKKKNAGFVNMILSNMLRDLRDLRFSL